MSLRGLFAALCLAAPAAADCPEGAFPPFYRAPGLFETALDDTAAISAAGTPLTGLTVPHHLVAPELIAGGLRLAAGTEYRRILLLHPDHFDRAGRAFATTGRGFETLFGPVPGDPAGAARLLASAAPVDTSCLFSADHGIRAILPFLARLFPGTPVLPVAIANTSTRADWEALAPALAPLAGPGTLVLQSTDFSHYLPHHEARRRDQQTLNLLATGDAAGFAGLLQPDHLDSRGAMYLQARLQARRGATPIVVQNRNGAETGRVDAANTTSYIVIAYAPFPDTAQDIALPGTETLLVAGDVFLGRAFARALPDELAARRLAKALETITGGLPVLANLEGVLLPEVPGTLGPMDLAMPSALATKWLRQAGVTAVSLANNHARDLGASGYAETLSALADAGIAAAGPGEALDLGRLRVVALSDLGPSATGLRNLLGPDDLAALHAADPARPVLAFVHWGREYLPEPGPRQRALAEAMSRAGATLVIGAHAHRASAGVGLAGGGDTALIASLGNFLFDQPADVASGAIAELRIFPQGTVFVRMFPIPNLYDAAAGLVPDG